MKHKKCYKEYTRVVVKTKQSTNSESTYEKGDFDSVCSVIKDEIIGQGKSISIDTLLNLFRDDITDIKQYRYYLKKNSR